MMDVLILCPVCLQEKPRESGHVNRSKKMGMTIYCGRDCAGMGRRKDNPKSPRNPNFKSIKREYDKEYRANNIQRIRAGKSARYKVTGPLNREKEKVYRQKRMPKHLEYCRQPIYKAKKKDYDRQYRAERIFGEFADAYLVLTDIDREIESRIDRTEIYRQNGTQNKWKQRRREYERITGEAKRN